MVSVLTCISGRSGKSTFNRPAICSGEYFLAYVYFRIQRRAGVLLNAGRAREMTAAPQQNPPPTAPDRGIDIANNMTDAVQVANDCAWRSLTGGEMDCADMTLSRIEGNWSDVSAGVPFRTRRAAVDFGDRLETYRKDHRARDVAGSVGFFVESGARVDHIVMGHSDAGPQNHLHKRPTVTGLDHRPTRLVDVPGDHSAGPGR